MIEAYALFAMFLVQIVIGSVLNPARLARYVRGWAANFGSERLAQLYPEFDYDRWSRRFATGYRAVHFVLVALGLALLARLYGLAQQPDWADRAENLLLFYFMLQMAPLALLALYSVVRYRKAFLQLAQEPKRKAVLQRRGLLDFVSPGAVAVAVASYVLFVPFAIWVDLSVYGNATLSRQCLITLFGVTMVYLFNGFVVYKTLYGRKNPFVSHEGRAQTIAMTVKSSVYGNIAVVWFVALMSFVGKLELKEWSPFALSMFFVITTLLSFIEVGSPPRTPPAEEPDAV
jgi:hypothetical protein